MATFSSLRYPTQAAIVAASYFLVARLGFTVTGMAQPVSPLWPAAGVGLAATLLYGWRIWPGIAVGALLSNLTMDVPIGLALWQTFDSCLQAVIPALVLTRYFDFHPQLDRLKDVWILSLVVCASVTVAATLDTLGFMAGGALTRGQFGPVWTIWFLGNLIGDLIVGCLLLSWERVKPADWKFARVLEVTLLLVLLWLSLQVTFFRPMQSDIWMPYWVFPAVILAAIRFGLPGGTAAAALICAAATWATLMGGGPFQENSLTDKMLALQCFIGLVGVTGLILASMVEELKQTEQTLREKETNLAAAQRVARFGTWELDLTNTDNVNANRLHWSDECYQVFGLEPAAAKITNDLFFRCVHPDDHEPIKRAVSEAIQKRSDYSIVHRISLPGGETRYIYEQARVFTDELTGRPSKMVGTAHDITEYQVANAKVRASEERYRLLAENATDMISRTDPQGVFIYVSPACQPLLGYSAEELVGQDSYALIHPEDVAAVRSAYQNTSVQKKTATVTYRFRRKDAAHVWVETTARNVIEPQTGRVLESTCVTRNITERLSLESQLQQAQKMDAIGRLAGGVAHDFNNLLTVISGYVGLILSELPAQHPVRDLIMEINKAADRAAGLTRQLLAFSRRSILEPKIVDLNALIRDGEKMIRRLIGEDIELTSVLAADLWPVKVDRAQMDQVILNLVVNARDAMPQGGKLTFETTNLVLDETYTHYQADARTGPHVRLAISDTGVGMAPEMTAHIFEPFFTTKGLGKGTGLGLATVYGIIKQSGGHISVYSEVGVGTTFKIYLPSVSEPVSPEKNRRHEPGKIVTGRGTILLVEDEESVRLFAERVLFDAGYRVLTAEDGLDALQLAERFLNDINLLITDVVMPRMSGRQLVEKLRAKKPNLKVLFMSGYTDDAVLRHGVLSAESAFLQKPFSGASLSEKVHAVITG